MKRLLTSIVLATLMLLAAWGTALASPPSQDAPPSRLEICDHIKQHAELTPKPCE